jgi:hypothetical protein
MKEQEKKLRLVLDGHLISLIITFGFKTFQKTLKQMGILREMTNNGKNRRLFD